MSKAIVNQLVTLDGSVTIDVADLASVASTVETSTGDQPFNTALDNRVVYTNTKAELDALNSTNFLDDQEFSVRGTTWTWNGTSFDTDSPVSVLSFGALPGLGDVSSQVQDAIDATPVGGVVVFPGGASPYNLQGTVTIDKRIAVISNGAQVNLVGAITGFDITAAFAGLSGFYLQGDRSAGQIGVRMGADCIRVRDLQVHDVDQGFEVWGGVWHRIESIRAENIVTTVLEVGNVVGTVVEDFRYDTRGGEDEPTTGIYLFGEGCNFSDIDIINCGTCLHITTNARSSTWNFFNSCSFDTSDYGLRITNIDSNFEVKGIMFDHCWFSSHRNQGILVDGNFNTEGITFADCFIINNSQGGLFVQEASNHVEVKGCVFAGNSQSLAGTYPHLRHASAGTVTAMATTFTSWGGLGNTSLAAVERLAGASYIIIDGCYSQTDTNNEGFSDNAPGNPRSIGHNFGNLISISKQRTETIMLGASTDASGDLTLAHNLGSDAWAAIAQMDPKSGYQCGVTSVDSSNININVTALNDGSVAASLGPFVVTATVYSEAYT